MVAACIIATAVGLALTAGPLVAQQAPGRLAGTVVAGESTEPLNGVQVYIHGLDVGTITNIDGRFFMPRVPAGTHDVRVQMIGYETKTITGLQVGPGETATIDVVLRATAIEVAGITVSAERERGSAAFLLDERRTSDAMLEAVGEAEISRSPASDAAEVATRMAGVTVTDGKYVFVRGLGERYSQTSLNGSTLPSPEPEKNVVPLDLFPADFLESLSTQKSYTPDMPGDFSGGTVKIATKDFPNRLQIKAGVGTSINTRSQFQDGFLTSSGGDLDFLGVDDGARGLPDIVEEEFGGLRGDRVSGDVATREALGEALQREFAPSETKVPMNRSFDLSIGNRFRLFDREVGFLTGLTYSDTYTRETDRIERKWRASAFDPDLPAESRQPNAGYTFTTGTRAVDLGTIANLSVLLTPEQKISLKTTYTRNADDEARRFVGSNYEDLGGVIRNERLRFVSRSLLWGQLSGEHALPFDARLEWRLNRASATRDEPGLREAIYIRPFGQDDVPFYLESAGESGRYFFSNLVDDDAGAEVDLRVPFPVWSDLTASVKAGLAARTRDRDFAARRFYWRFNGAFTDLTDALGEGSIVGFIDEPGQFAIDEIVEPGDQYQVEEAREAAYVMAEVPLTSALRSVLGVRMERYDLGLTSRDESLADRDRTDVLPAVNLIYKVSDEMNVRAAVSQTLDSPEFRELAPFQFTEATSLTQVYGNPGLVVARVRSADLRWEWFPAPGEVVSVGAFMKRIKNPIEQVFFATASTAFSYQNAKRATLSGIELDIRHNLGAIDEVLAPFTLQTNVALIQSEVDVVRSGAFQPTTLDRPLEGQSPYVINSSIQYRSPNGTPEIGLYYNIFGPRLVAAGGFGIPDIYEQPRSQFDLTFTTALPGDARLKFKAKNLLDAEYRFEQEANGIGVVQKRYRLGRTFSFGLSWQM